jgi:putative flippase GtrA
MIDRRGIKRFFKYSSVGFSTFLFDLFLLYLLTDIIGMQYLVAAGIAFLVAVSVNFLFSRTYVFKGSEQGVGIGYAQFLLIAGSGLLFVVGAMYVLVGVLGVPYLLARVGVAAITGFWNYLLNLYVNFKVAGK